jgi:hypothetical protein
MASKQSPGQFYEFLEARLRDFEERLIRMEKNLSRISSGTIERFNEITAELDFMQRSFKSVKNDIKKYHLTEKISENEECAEEIELIKIPINNAKELVKEFVESHPGSTFSEIFLALKLEPKLVIEALKLLSEKKEIRGFPVE